MGIGLEFLNWRVYRGGSLVWLTEWVNFPILRDKTKVPTAHNIGREAQSWRFYETFKSFRNINGLNNIFTFSKRRNNLVSDLKISQRIPRNVQQVHRRFLTERVREVWNKLPCTVRESESVNSFKCN